MVLSASVLYPPGITTPWTERRALLRREFSSHFGTSPTVWCSAPGRTELGGNHTDHNRGRVLAAAVRLDALAAAAPGADGRVTVYSVGYEHPFVVPLHELSRLPEETGTSSALIRGTLARLKELGFVIGGFDAVVHSDVAVGSGLSSSAAFEVLLGTLVNHLFNGGGIPPQIIATTGQFAENRYFDKPCGLMDQLASAIGGASQFDFADPSAPGIERVPLDPAGAGYTLCVVQSGGSHADLTADYASIPSEMRNVARACGVSECRDLQRDVLMANARRIRAVAGDRAFLRALHFLDENERVLEQVSALRMGNFPRFLALVNASGRSSAMLLQNCWAPTQTREQGLAVALALTGDFLAEAGGGACRVHGGGFAGTIQAYIPSESMQQYVRTMESFFGQGCVIPLHVRPEGAVAMEIAGNE